MKITLGTYYSTQMLVRYGALYNTGTSATTLTPGQFLNMVLANPISGTKQAFLHRLFLMGNEIVPASGHISTQAIFGRGFANPTINLPVGLRTILPASIISVPPTTLTFNSAVSALIMDGGVNTGLDLACPTNGTTSDLVDSGGFSFAPGQSFGFSFQLPATAANNVQISLIWQWFEEDL